MHDPGDPKRLKNNKVTVSKLSQLKPVIITIGMTRKTKKKQRLSRGYGKVHTCLTVPMSYGVRMRNIS